MTVGTRFPARRGDGLAGLWSEVGEQLVRGQSHIDARLDRLESDVAMLKADVAEIKTDLAETRGQLNRLELATERGFSRVDARFEELITLVLRAGSKSS